MLEPFEGQPANTGIPIHAADELGDLVGRAVAAGQWPVIHAIGDRANREVLDAFTRHREAASRAGGGVRLQDRPLLPPAPSRPSTPGRVSAPRSPVAGPAIPGEPGTRRRR